MALPIGYRGRGRTYFPQKRGGRGDRGGPCSVVVRKKRAKPRWKKKGTVHDILKIQGSPKSEASKKKKGGGGKKRGGGGGAPSLSFENSKKVFAGMH